MTSSNIYKRSSVSLGCMTNGTSLHSNQNVNGGSESLFLEDHVHQLNQELLKTRTELNRVTDQLNCLISLVKRAWTGDNEAAIHVANIVGVAPPDFDVQEIDQNAVLGRHIGKPKSRPINNWAVLAIGLLNREYKRLERELEERQQHHLQERQLYLDEQLVQARDAVFHLKEHSSEKVRSCASHAWNAPSEDYKNGRKAFMTQPPPSPVNNGSSKQLSRPSSSHHKKPAVRQLYRSPMERKADRAASAIAFNDLFANSTGNSGTDLTMDGLYRLPSKSSQGTNGQHTDRQDVVMYDDPARYNRFGLFDADSALGPEVALQKKRPPSGKQQRLSDNARARPKSAVTPAIKAERPLKYETTKPISASSSNLTKGQGQRRAKSAGTMRQRTQSLTDLKNEQIADEDDIHQPKPAPMKIKIKPPESVTQFTKDMHRMASMEEDFKRTTLDLQRKLGINPDGMVY